MEASENDVSFKNNADNAKIFKLNEEDSIKQPFSLTNQHLTYFQNPAVDNSYFEKEPMTLDEIINKAHFKSEIEATSLKA